MHVHCSSVRRGGWSRRAIGRRARWVAALALTLLASGVLGAGAASAAPFVYVANSGDNTISQFTQQPGGQLTALTPASVSALGEPGALVASPDVRNVYATVEGTEWASGSLEQFSIAADGTLQPLAPAEVPLPGRPTSVAISPDGRFVYATDFEGRGAVAQFAVGSDGALSPLSPASVPVEGASEIVLAPDGRFAYVVDGEEEGAVWQFEVAPDGTLHPLSPASIQEVGFKPHGISISPDGRDVYVVDGHADLRQFAVTANGTLAELSPASVSTAGYPVSVGWSNDGRQLVVPELEEEEPQGVEVWRGVVQSFERGPDGTLSVESSTPAPAGALPWGVAVSPDGQEVYVTNESSSGAEGLFQYGLDPGGALAPLTPAFAETGDGPRAIAIAAQPSPSPEPPADANPPAGVSPSSAGSTQAPAGSAQPSEPTPEGTPKIPSVSRRPSRAPVVQVTIPATATFCFDCTRLSPAMAALVRRLRRYARGARLVSIASYADATGGRAYNMALTHRRSQAIAQLLLTGLSPAPHRVAITWHGESDPVASNQTAAGRARNRRTVIRIVR